MTILVLWMEESAELDKGLPCSNGRVPTKEKFEIADKMLAVNIYRIFLSFVFRYVTCMTSPTLPALHHTS